MSIRKTMVGLAVVVSLLLAGCNRTEEEWKKTKQEDTPEAYSRFLTNNPASDHASEAKVTLRSKRLSFVLSSRDLRAVQAFLELYPDDADAQLLPLAEQLRWNQLSKSSPELEWKNFVEDFPFSKYAAAIKTGKRFLFDCPRPAGMEEQVRQKSRLAKSRPHPVASAGGTASAGELGPGRYIGKADDGLTFVVDLCRDANGQVLRLQGLSVTAASAPAAEGSVALSQLQGVGSKVFGRGNNGRVDFCARAITARITFQPGNNLLSMAGSAVSVELETRGEYVGFIVPDGTNKARLDVLRLTSPLSDALDFGVVAVSANQVPGGLYKMSLSREGTAKTSSRGVREQACLATK